MEKLSPKEQQELRDYLGFGPSIPEEKHNVHSFLNKVATSDDTTKTGNLTSEELGNVPLTLRANKELELVSRYIMENDYFAKYFAAKSEIITSSSLSKDATLIKLAVVQKRVIEDTTKKKTENRGLFRKKEESPEEGEKV